MASAGAPPPPPPGAPPGRGARPSAASQRPAAADDISEIEEVGPRVELRRDAEFWQQPEAQRERSLSFDDVYALAPTQDGLSRGSKLVFAPLEGMESDMRRASSADDLEALLGGAYTQDAQGYLDEYDDLASQDDATVQSAPLFGTKVGGAGRHGVADPYYISGGAGRHGGASLDGAGAHDRESRDSLDPADWDEVEPRAGTRGRYQEEEGEDDDEEDEEARALLASPSERLFGKSRVLSFPSERLFGKSRARELRQRIVRQRDVSEEAAGEALNAATAAMVDSGSTETLEFITWFSVWLLILFYLLFYSSYGPMLWRFLYGPMGAVLTLPFAFALLFWLAAAYEPTGHLRDILDDSGARERSDD
ncbi:hypothetical protein T484DRAFT_1894271 [Baffinella frigidus]|nr:hypothetical protein T484DRAFT_1894271 [Cryptophyta sp. CCMP2293]